MRPPSARFERVRQAVDIKSPLADPLEHALYEYLTTRAPSDAGDAYDLFADSDNRAVLEAFLLAGGNAALIERVIGVKAAVTEAYRHLFFDESNFRNRLEIFRYVADFQGSPHAKEVLRTAVNSGLDYLLWAYGRGEVQIDARQVIRHTMAEAYYRGMAHRGNSVTSQVAKEAHKWWGSAVRNAELLEKIDPRAEKQAFEEIRIQLEKFDDTYKADEAPVDVTEILH